MAQLTNRALFEGLADHTFATYGEVEDRFLEIYNRHMLEGNIPPGLHYDTILEWAEKRRLLKQTPTGYEVDLSVLSFGD